MSEAVLLVGTKKGLWIGRSDADRERWTWSDPEFLMQGIYGLGIDTRGDTPRMFASGTSEHWGPGVYYSDDLGHTWTEAAGAAVRFPEDLGDSVERVWQIQPGGPDQPDVVWAGTQPSALFRSEDRGESFSLVRSLWDHPHRTQWGAGFGGQAIHTILPHPDDHSRVTVAMSTGGVYRTFDAGSSWAPPTSASRLTSCLTRGRSTASACTRSPFIRPPLTSCTPRTTTACTAPTTAGTAGSRSPTGCRPTSASRSSSTPGTRTRCSSSHWWPTGSGCRRRARRGCGARLMPAGAGPARPAVSRTASSPR